jgi:hypothetical protein
MMPVFTQFNPPNKRSVAMLYRFSSQATHTVILQQAPAQAILQHLNKPDAPQGVFTLEQLPAAIALLQHWPEPANEQHEANQEPADSMELPPEPPIAMRQRAVPLIALMQTALAAGCMVVWSA